MIISRRKFLGFSLAGGVTAALASYGVLKHDSGPAQLEEIPVKIPDLPASFDGYRVGLITDSHVGPCSSVELTEQAVQQLNSSKIDLALFGGDFILMPDYFTDRSLLSVKNGRNCFMSGASYQSDLSLADAAFESSALVLANAKAGDGRFAVFGNHDLWVSPRLCQEHLEANGVRLLVNERVTITRGAAKLELFGADDWWAGAPTLPNLPNNKERDSVRLLLAHNPDYYSYLLQNTKLEFDLALAGHTHAGQIKLPLVGALYSNVQDRRLMEGLFADGARTVYTSRGLGVVGIPVRINCPPEVTVFTLLRA